MPQADAALGLCPDGAAERARDPLGVVGAQVVMRPKAPSGREKDKSTKRKSNLNRALTEEQVAVAVAGVVSESQGQLPAVASFQLVEHIHQVKSLNLHWLASF